MKTLKQLIKDGKFNYVNSDITEEHYPSEKIRGKVKIFHFDRFISSEDVIKKMEKEEYQPANIYELLEYAEKDWNEKDWVVALGSVRLDSSGSLRVLVLSSDSGRRRFSLSYFGSRWSRGCVFAGVLRSSDFGA